MTKTKYYEFAFPGKFRNSSQIVFRFSISSYLTMRLCGVPSLLFSKKSDQKRCMGKVLETRTGFNLGYLHAEQCWQVAYEPVNRY